MKAFREFYVPKQDFQESAVKVNQKILRAAAVFVVVIEFMNMLRVLAFTSTKLGTLNNRIYFGFYLVYFVGCAVFLALDFGVKLSVAVRYRIYMTVGSLVLLWHTLFNMYDIHRAGAIGNITVVTAMVLMFSIFWMKPAYAMANLIVNYGIFMLFLHINDGFSSGEIINFTITALVCGLIYFVRYWHMGIELSQARMITNIQQELTETRRNFSLSLEQYELIRERGNYVTFEWDIRKDRISFSRGWQEWFHEPADIMRFTSYIDGLEVVDKEQKRMLQECIEGVKRGAAFQKYELCLPMKTGVRGWFELRVIAQKNVRGEPAVGIGTLSDITPQKEHIQRLEQELQLDLFTGLLNKAAIESYGERKLEELEEGECLAALILDMDDFKEINDSLGHPAGDRILREVAGLIQEKAPAGARIGRIGGDEFLVLFKTGELQGFAAYAGELIRDVSGIRLKDAPAGASCSIGISISGPDKITYAELYQKTDQALYLAKRNGKGQICCYGQQPFSAMDEICSEI